MLASLLEALGINLAVAGTLVGFVGIVNTVRKGS